ncbi:MAG: transcriptional regulator, DeoR family [Frankiales bacterium]|nr:transcriptional regulator, DeoR family [Frankiales bacterium]
MYAEERQRATAAQAREQGRVEVTDLAATFGVSAETVRRDLQALEAAGLLRRVHGGAIPTGRMAYEPALADRDATMTTEKERIAKAALPELEGATSILLDAGTTTARLAELLPDDVELTVVTNGLPIALALAARPHLTVLTIGGRLRARTGSTVDAMAVAALAGLYVDVAFLGTNGLSAERGLTTPDPAEAAVKTAMIRSARRAVVLADSSKAGNDQLVRFAALDEVEAIVTDSGLDPELAARLQDCGPRVVRA